MNSNMNSSLPRWLVILTMVVGIMLFCMPFYVTIHITWLDKSLHVGGTALFFLAIIAHQDYVIQQYKTRLVAFGASTATN